MNRRLSIFLGAIVAVVLGLIVAQYALQPVVIEAGPAHPTAQTTGVVKSLAPAPLLSASPLQRATVRLAEGGEVEASVLPGCVVHLGDAVRVHVFGGSGPTEHIYVVVGQV